MKRTRIIMAMLVLFGMSTLTEAQIVVTSTTASTTHIKAEKTKSGREKGLVIRPEAGAGVGIISVLAEINGTVAYHFSPYFAIGGGLGYDYESYYLDCVSRPSTMPVFANARVYFCDRKWSPFLDLKIGYNIPITKGVRTNSYMTESHTIFGFNIGGTLGIQYKNYDFGITFRQLEIYYDYDSYSYGNTIDYYSSPAIMFSIAYNFQLKNK